jgi:hypothetical protein
MQMQLCSESLSNFRHPESIIEKIKSLSSPSAEVDFTISNNRQTDFGVSESDVSPIELENMFDTNKL